MNPQHLCVALKPDAVFYLRIVIEQSPPRVVFSRGFDYWESGMDLFPGQDIHEGFCSYQATLLAKFDRLAEEYKFEIVDASADADSVCAHLKKKIQEIIEPVRGQEPAAKLPNFFGESLADKIFANLRRGYERTETRAEHPFLQSPRTFPFHAQTDRAQDFGRIGFLS